MKFKADKRVIIFVVVICALTAILLISSKVLKHSNLTGGSRGNNDFQVDSYDDFRKLATLLKDDDGDSKGVNEKFTALEEKITALQEQLARSYQEIGDLTNYIDQKLQAQPVQNQETYDPGKSEDNNADASRDYVRELQIVRIHNGSATKSLHIPAGTFAKATLLTGLYAPVNSGALPVLLKIESIGIGPNHSQVPISNAFAIAKGIGEPNSIRAILQLETLSVVSQKGDTIEKSVNGFIADSDGIQGVKGSYVYRIGEAGFLSVITSGLTSASKAFSRNQTTTTISPEGTEKTVVTGDAFKFATGNAVAGAADKIANIYEKRLDEIVPAVFVPNGKLVTIIFINGVSLEGLKLEEAYVNEGNERFSSLDSNR